MQHAPMAAQAITKYFCRNKAALFTRLLTQRFFGGRLAWHGSRGSDRCLAETAPEQRSKIMWDHTEKSHAARTRLSLEQLEARQLMAADALASAIASANTFRNPNPTPTNTTPVVATRTFDGTGNNLAHTQWGSTGEELLRKAAAEYGDGISTLAGADRPSGRVISNALAAQTTTELSDRELSAYIYVWGQFLDHDIDLTQTGTTSADIAVPTGDQYF